MKHQVTTVVLWLGVGIAATVQATEPRPFWATQDGLVDLQLHRTPVTLDSVVNRLGIEEAFARWGIAVDEGRLDVLQSLLTPDAEVTTGLGNKQPMASHVGREANAERMGRILKQHADQRRHAISNIVIEQLTKNTATAYAYCLVTRAADGLSLTATVIYSTRLRREADGVWRFSYINIGLDADTQPPVVEPKK